MTSWLRSFLGALSAIVLGAVVLRVLHTLFIAPETGGLSDSFWYAVAAQNISLGNGIVAAVGAPDIQLVTSAQHPPAYPVVLAGAIKLGIDGDTGWRLLGALFGGLTVLGVGLLGRRVSGAAVGLVAAAIAAVYPLMLAVDGALLAETLYGPIVAFTLVVAWDLGERPSIWRAALLGVGIALATLTRSEALLLLPLLALPLAWRGPAGRARWLRLGGVVAACAVVLAPWVIRNWSVFDRPLLSTNDGALLAWTNCDQTYHGEFLGYLVPECGPPVTGDEAEQASKLSRHGLDYARDHAGRLPVVMAARLLGTWSFYDPFRFPDPGRNETVLKVGILFYYVLFALAVVGAVALRRRGRPLWVLLAPVLTVCLVAMATYTSIRLRYLAEIPLVVLAAAGAVALSARVRGRADVAELQR
jgi:4-amino-4-deoxy-L-arabinose transferase-like glycosyltransferase